MKTLLRISLPALTLSLAGAWSVYHATNLPTIAHVNMAPPVSSVIPGTQAPKIWAQKATLHQGETFDLHFSVPNAPYLGVVDPKGHFFYLIFPGAFSAGALTPLITGEQFVATSTLTINTGTLKADPYIYGVMTNQPVFTQTGNYTFITGEDLHVDDPGLLDKVVIRYVHVAVPWDGCAVVERP